MNGFITIRDKIRRFVLAREILFIKLWNMLIAFVGLLCINNNFGYQKIISKPGVSLLLAIACGFLPLSGVSVVLMLVLVIDLLSLSVQVALVAVALLVIGYLVCAYFHSKNTYNMVTVPICFGLNTPYTMALGTGLLSNLNEVVSVLCGSVAAYYLHIVKYNAAAILDETSEVSVIALLKEQMLQNKMFYFYMVAMAAMVVIVYKLRSADIRMSWLIAAAAGVIVEFIIMLSGLLISSQKSEIPELIIGNVLALVVGFILNYFVLDLDYSRIEKVQFEDDDYYYYVTAVPKIRIVEEEKEVKTF